MSDLLRVFVGFDHRQPVSYTTLQHSLYANSSKPLSITPLVLPQLPIKRQGLTPFTWSRFLVPYLCDYKGWALFLDADMLAVDDIAKLFELRNEDFAVMVVKNKKRFEWASLMLFNCEKCSILTPEYIETGQGLHGIEFVDERLVGELPARWNHLVGYDDEKDIKDLSLIHYTQGVPCFPETSDCEHAIEWVKTHKQANSAQSWQILMGNSVHACKINDKILPKYHAKKYETQAIKTNEQGSSKTG